MYKKLARIGMISCGVFYALMMLLFYLAAIGVGVATGNVDLVNSINAPSMMALNMVGVELPPVEPTEINMMGIAYGAGLTLVSGFIVGLLSALIYNIVALFTGGIKMKVNDLGYDDI